MKIPRVMSTQHPDNVSIPFFAEHADMSGEDEIQEAYYAFSHLGCDEQMWDSEGKEVDDFVVKKLFSKYPTFFKNKKLGKDFFITLRIPNPTVEKEEAKILVEALESIPRSMDAAKAFYENPYPPIFEVILPMTTSAQELNRVYYFYKDFISGKQYQKIYEEDITVAEWVGEFLPERINVIPLFEDVETLFNVDKILFEYLKDKDFNYLRVFLARSDPAMNYGMVSAVLAIKVALKKLEKVSKEKEIEIYPILGAGTPPFRGNLSPYTVDKVLNEYSPVETFTVQSAFKYDFPIEDVIAGIKKLKNFIRYPLEEVDENFCKKIIKKFSKEYHTLISALAPAINELAKYVPKRRMRKLHIGLFGYSRSIGGVTLPRVINFCAACYSIGLPPELLGLNCLDKEELRDLKEVYKNLEYDFSIALQYFNPKCLELLNEEEKNKIIKSLEILNSLNIKYTVHMEHKEVTTNILKNLKKGLTSNLSELLIEGAYLRKFLG
uniref:Phosphoenolpyruvate carboxylase n=1 Tax=Thermodesulfobacterium geofontis TaxID=1295609 RepID=A0A7V4JPN4_9BACT